MEIWHAIQGLKRQGLKKRAIGRSPGKYHRRPTPARQAPPPQWVAFFTTDMGLAADKVVKKYLCRWSMEVFCKEAKTLLGLGKDHSRSFAAQVGATTLTLLRFNMLAYIKAQRDAAQTSGGLFRELTEGIGFLTFQDKIIAYFRQFLYTVLNFIDQAVLPSARFRDFIKTFDIVINKLDMPQGCET